MTMAKTKRIQARLEVFAAKFPGFAEAVAADFGFIPEALFCGGGAHPDWALSHARAVAMWLAYQTGETGYPPLAELFGVGYTSCRARVIAIDNQRGESRKFAARLNALCDAVGVSL